MASETKKAAPALSREEFEERIATTLEHRLHKTFETATASDIYSAAASVVNMLLTAKRIDFNKTRHAAEKKDPSKKKVYYLCMEFLMGQSLKNHLYNLNLSDTFAQLLEAHGMKPAEIYDCEPDAGLGNGGLGRLAACFMDALATGGYDATGFSLRYEYGLFKQSIVDGWQVELPDNWLPGGHVWLNPVEADKYKVGFYGDYDEWWADDHMNTNISNQEIVEAVPYDMYVSGADSDAVIKLRLWRAKDSDGFDIASFNSGDFTKAAQKANHAELITKVLYPADNIDEGKALRIKQEYFLVSASCQNIVREYIHDFGSLAGFGNRVVIHINDTHPAMCIPELMRIFLDDYGYSWDSAWANVSAAVSYTNHTVLAEALEKWNAEAIRNMLPRIYAIIKEIDRRFRNDISHTFPGDNARIDNLAPIAHGNVYMANLSVIGSHKVNGVSQLHSDILKNDLFHDFYIENPDKFTNVTNGIAYRRWLCQSNPRLSALIDDYTGKNVRTDCSALTDFGAAAGNASVRKEINTIKDENKVRLSDMIARTSGRTIDPDGIFIVQAKRLHEYKRQLLNALRIISRYQQIKDNPNSVERPEVYLFAAKAAPSYYHAKFIIQLICELGEEIRKDPAVSDKLQVVFLENYSVSMAETLMPAAEVSEQISLAGKEASGTGNMKAMINGAVTIGTLDGANVEMLDAVGSENIFIFGQKTEEVNANIRSGYNAADIYASNETLRRAVDALGHRINGKDFTNIKDYLLKPSYSIADPYMCLKDFDDYVRAHNEIQTAYEDRDRWASMSIANISGAARFSADRSIADYANNIWHTKPVL